ncbi:MAG: dihydroorotase, partial [Clostridia bacterium]|nr:dihydroorotase [Clostridia bacterium]
HGGYTAVCTMPNLNPVPDCIENIMIQKEIIKNDSVINIYPYASITKNECGTELSQMKELSDYAVAFSDDGKGVQDDKLMKEAMITAKSLGKIIAAHCEDNSLLNGGYIHKGSYAAKHNHRGICSESEYRQLERDLNLAAETGCSYHVCHISCKESVEMIREAKKSGMDVSCETAPHYLVLDETCLQEDGRFKMNPPLRNYDDKKALIEGITDGTIDMIATDHAPHSAEEKSQGLKKSAFGIVGLETAFPLLYTHLVKGNIIKLTKLIELLNKNPRERFGIPFNDGFTIWNLNKKHIVDSKQFLSKGKSTPFEGMELYGVCLATVCNDKISYAL